MEYRKLISFGNSSHVVSLPKDWLEKNGLTKGDTIYLDVNGTDITLHPQEMSSSKKVVEHIINVDGLNNEVITRKINSAYMNNADIIRIKGDDLTQKTRSIKEIIQNLVAMEVVEQDTQTIVAKSFLNIKDVDVSNIIRKADHIINTMLNDLDKVAELPPLEAIEISDNITQRDEDVNRMCFLVFRALNHNPYKKIETGPGDSMLGLWGLNFFLEEVGDEVKRIARLVAKAESRKNLPHYMKIIKQIRENYKNIMKGFYTKDKELIYTVAGNRDDLIKDCEDYLEENMNLLNVALIDKTKDLIDKVHNINRITTMCGMSG